MDLLTHMTELLTENYKVSLRETLKEPNHRPYHVCRLEISVL